MPRYFYPPRMCTNRWCTGRLVRRRVGNAEEVGGVRARGQCRPRPAATRYRSIDSRICLQCCEHRLVLTLFCDYVKQTQTKSGPALWLRLFQVDPDFLTGYNCINFDLCYLLTRAAALKAEGVASLSRLKSMESRISDTRFSSR